MNSREIKFRFWKTETKEWVDFPGRGLRSFEPIIENCYTDHDYFVIQQYTGSTDSAQKPIYEGDVVLWHTEDHFEGGYSYKKMVVGWNQRCMQFRLFEFPNQVGKAAGETFWAEDVRVIGHVFDYKNEECRYHLDESVKGLIKPLEPKFKKDGENWKEVV